MTLRNKLAASVAALGFGSTMAVAEGLERVNLDTSFMYETGTYAELSYGFVNPSIPAEWTGGNSDNLAGSFAVVNVAAKTKIGDRIDVGLWRTNNSSGVSLDWGPTFPVKAELTSSALVGLIKYQISENFAVMGGIKQVRSDSGASVTTSLGTSLGLATYTIGSGNASVGVYGISYERPEIALRVELLAESEGEMAITDTRYSLAGGTAAGGLLNGDHTGTSKIGVGDALTLKFQTGIAPNTLLFGSIRNSKWANNQVQAPTPALAGVGPVTLSTFGDGQSYTLGVGRKLSETVSGSLSVFSDPASDCDNVSALAPTCENTAINLGAKVALAENMNLSLGTTWSRRGKATVGSFGATTNKSVVTSIGAKLSVKF